MRKGIFVIIHDGQKDPNKRKYLVLRNEKTQKLSFVGGGIETQDKNDYLNAAKRETQEETGIPAQHFTFKKLPLPPIEFTYQDGNPAIQELFLAKADKYAQQNAHLAGGDYITGKYWMTEKELAQAIERKGIVETFKDAIQYI